MFDSLWAKYAKWIVPTQGVHPQVAKVFIWLGLPALAYLLVATGVKNVLPDESPLHFLVIDSLGEGILAAVSLICMFLAFIGFATVDGSSAMGQSKQTIYALVPLSSHAKGDGLLMAAGFLAANDVYENVEVKVLDHNNNELTARNILKKLCDNWSITDGPLWVVCTMSKISAELSIYAQDYVRTRPQLNEQFTLVLTVAGAPNILDDSEAGIIRYSINGADEIDRIEVYLSDSPGRDKFAPILLLPVGSEYPRRSLGQLAERLTVAGRAVFSLPMKLDGEPEARPSTVINMSAFGSNHAVVFGYDLAMFNSFKFLVESGFQGTILTASTLSVPDWQQYLEKRNDLTPSTITYKTLAFERASSESAKFQAALEAWTFQTLTQSKHLYDSDAGNSARARFSDLEQEVYQTIEPNFISALCFDTVRLLSLAKAEKLKRFVSIESISRRQLDDPGPFGGARYSGIRGHLVPKAKIYFEEL